MFSDPRSRVALIAEEKSNQDSRLITSKEGLPAANIEDRCALTQEKIGSAVITNDVFSLALEHELREYLALPKHSQSSSILSLS